MEKMIHDSHKDGAHGVPRVKKSASGVVVLPLPNEGNRRPLALAALGPTARAHRHHSRVAHAIWHVHLGRRRTNDSNVLKHKLVRLRS